MALSAVYTPEFVATADPDVVTLYTSTAYNPGDLVMQANGLASYVVGVQPNVTANGSAAVSFSTRGCGKVPSASATTFADGAHVYWNPTTRLAVTSGSAAGDGGFFLGTARGAKTSGQLTVQVDLNKGLLVALTT